MITADEERALNELARVTKGGYLYLLVYATEGMRWPLIQWLRPLAGEIGEENLERAIQIAGLPPTNDALFSTTCFVLASISITGERWNVEEPGVPARGALGNCLPFGSRSDPGGLQ